MFHTMLNAAGVVLRVLFLNPATQLRSIGPYLDLKTANTISTSVIHAKLDYCNSLHYNLSEYQLNRLELIQNSLDRAVVRAPKLLYITPSLRSLRWPKIKEQLDCKILLLTKSLLLPNHLISMILSLFNHFTALVPLMLSTLLVHLLIPL